jgi:predicted AlkP superfamily phosphohydrolase/phosphomutase
LSRKLFVLSLDGTPYTLLQQALRKDFMPNLAHLSREGSLVQMDSLIPTISSVAWATFATGVNPAQHHIFGFVDRDPNGHLTIPNASHLQAKTLWQYFDERGLHSVWINLPIAYPPAKLKGVMISGFLGTDLNDCVHPAALLAHLKKLNYVIDPDPWLARTDRAAFIKELFHALRPRREITLHLLSQPWDFFMLHVMETDRLHHFFWDAKDDVHSAFHADFWNLYAQIDQLIGSVLTALPNETEFMMLSDHGFCALKQEVDLNAYLQDTGFLRYRNDKPQDLNDLHPQTRAFSLLPGRIYVNLKERESQGSVSASDYERVRTELSETLLRLKEPRTGESVINKTIKREELYHGAHIDRAADLIAVPNAGYDLKAKLTGAKLFDQGAINGMHTFDDAFLYLRGHSIRAEPKPALVDVPSTLFSLMGLATPANFEGKNLLGANP